MNELLLTDEEIRFSCLGEGFYWGGEQLTGAATEPPPVLMPQFKNVAQAQLDKILKAGYLSPEQAEDIFGEIVKLAELYEVEWAFKDSKVWKSLK